MYKLQSKVIRIVCNPTGELPQEIVSEIFIAKDGGEDVRIKYDGKEYDVHKGEYITLDEEEVKELLFKKLDRLGETILEL